MQIKTNKPINFESTKRLPEMKDLKKDNAKFCKLIYWFILIKIRIVHVNYYYYNYSIIVSYEPYCIHIISIIYTLLYDIFYISSVKRYNTFSMWTGMEWRTKAHFLISSQLRMDSFKYAAA